MSFPKRSGEVEGVIATSAYEADVDHGAGDEYFQSNTSAIDEGCAGRLNGLKHKICSVESASSPLKLQDHFRGGKVTVCIHVHKGFACSGRLNEAHLTSRREGRTGCEGECIIGPTTHR